MKRIDPERISDKNPDDIIIKDEDSLGIYSISVGSMDYLLEVDLSIYDNNMNMINESIRSTVITWEQARKSETYDEYINHNSEVETVGEIISGYTQYYQRFSL